MCTVGSSSNGGLAPNTEGYCEAYCSLPYDGVRYCGDGDDYSKGDSINCKGCAQSQGQFLPFELTNLFILVHN